MGDVLGVDGERQSRTRPQKRAGEKSETRADQFKSDDDVVALTALRDRLAEILACGDVHERDLKAVSVEYRAVRAELKAAVERAEAKGLGRRGPLAVVGGRSFDGDI